MAMKHQRISKNEVGVKVTFSETENATAIRGRCDVPTVNVVAIRGRTGLSQTAFAESIGVPKATLINWEQGRRQPSGPAKVLLALLAKRPNLVAELYLQTQPRSRWESSGQHPSEMTPEQRLAELGQILAAGIIRLRQVTADSR